MGVQAFSGPSSGDSTYLPTGNVTVLSIPRSYIHPRYEEPRWRFLFCDSDYRLPVFWRDWLSDTGSLTDRLLKASSGDLSVQIIRQGLQQPKFSERQALKLDTRAQAMVREIILVGKGQPWVYARSIVPLSTLTGRLRALRQLDNRPLGALLFKDPTMSREPVQVANMQSQLPLFDFGQGSCNKPLWGRRSVFRLDKKPLLVSEIFLESFKQYHQQNNQA